VVRDAETTAVPTVLASNAATTVPQPWPGTHPEGLGDTAGVPSDTRTTEFELPAKPQYVLWRTTDRLSPTWIVIARPFEVSPAVIVAGGRGEGVLPGPDPEGLAEGPWAAPQAVARAHRAAAIAIAAFDLM
jgi:hypothetical protein